MKNKIRKISSVSGVITNSSTEVFEINITNKLIDILNKEGIYDNLLMIIDKTDLIKLFNDTEKLIEEGKNEYYSDKFQSFIEYIHLNDSTEILCLRLKEEKLSKEIEKFIKESGYHEPIEWDDDDSIFCDYGVFGEVWKLLRKSGKSIENIVDFLEPIFKNTYGKALYSCSDHGLDPTSNALKNNGYYPCY